MRTGYEGFASVERTHGTTAGAVAHARAPGAGLPAQSADTGQLFLELRRCLKLPLPELARRLETRIDVIQALESGDMTRLPPWPETVRVVSAYTLLAKIDPRPVLHVLGERISAERTIPGPRSAPQPAAGKSVRAAEADMTGGESRMAGILARLRSVPMPTHPMMRWGGLAGVLIVAAIALTSQLPKASASGSGFSVSNMLGGFSSLFATSERTVSRDGMRWIEVEDPRARKSDKLRSPSP